MKTYKKRAVRIGRAVLKIIILFLTLIAFVAVSIVLAYVGAMYISKNDDDSSYVGAKSIDDYYLSIMVDSLLLQFYILCVTFAGAAIWGLKCILFPDLKPKWMKPIPQRKQRVIAAVFLLVLLFSRAMAYKNTKEIRTRDYSQDEGPWAEVLYIAWGFHQTVALISAEGLVITVYTLRKNRLEQRGKGEQDL